ncbi:class I SAM-dependent methyltransferase [Amaricoccus solimangrovi]|uniref:Class I SAM-dependent methyltransferase n=1 Tax=Amaricoccus solimangrovi TaxID=2589815 RepID=A0A501WQB0_9RHOB|nr:class I SAM-dependent methyltransferase [Amaricoccus solimangrovi]TPE47966.1 class I SAM-dependent methyltransferase [Amaricoccus solimangrovi]
MNARPLPAGPAAPEDGHAALMDGVYRYQRHFYDLTRRPYLLGREHLLDRLAPPARGHVLEIACGTGRNLAGVLRRHPEVCLYGLDISEEMLRSAARTLGGRARLASGDARAFDAPKLFGREGFHRIILSYSLSMIPDWRGALAEAARHLAPGGELHVVDFGDQSGMPRWFDAGLRAWLARFHVTPRGDLATALAREAEAVGGAAVWSPLLRSYAQYGVLIRHD